MAKSYYMPTNGKEKAVWLRNFSIKLANFASVLNIQAAELTSVINDSTAYSFHLDVAEIFKQEARERVSYRDTVGNAPIGTVLGALPTMPVLPIAPVAVPAGIFPRIAALVRRIKAHPAYTEAMGMDLGIIGAEPVMNFDAEEPTLTLSKAAGVITIKYVRGDNDGIQLYCKRGSEQEFNLLKVLNGTSYRDSRPNLVPGQPETRQYMAWFIKYDERSGQESGVKAIVI